MENQGKPKVAVVTRTKDRSLFLARAIESVVRQTFTDYVHVIINDGGDKSSLERLIKDQPADIQANIKIFHRGTASGAPDTIFNEAIDKVDSEYFAIHDDDDTWHKDFLKETVCRLDENSSLGAVVVHADKVTEVVSEDAIVERKRSRWMPSVKVVNLYRQCIDNQMTPIATLYRRSAYEAIGKFDDTLPVVGDWEFGVRLLTKYDVDFIDPGFALANYHHRKYSKGQDSHNTSFAGNDKHRYYTNLVMNRYLRQELTEGRLGIGYIMSTQKYTESKVAEYLKKMLPTSIVERMKRKAGN